jgi:coproporphyrinogen III oxidase-like Fe-S oxidoreductase
VPRLDDYLQPASDGLPPVIDVESPDEVRMLRERTWTGLRLAEGVDATSITLGAESLRPGAGERIARVVASQREQGRLLEEQGRWRLTNAGMLHADGIAVEFMDAIDG